MHDADAMMFLCSFVPFQMSHQQRQLSLSNGLSNRVPTSQFTVKSLDHRLLQSPGPRFDQSSDQISG